jgi:hypothetical protein
MRTRAMNRNSGLRLDRRNKKPSPRSIGSISADTLDITNGSVAGAVPWTEIVLSLRERIDQLGGHLYHADCERSSGITDAFWSQAARPQKGSMSRRPCRRLWSVHVHVHGQRATKNDEARWTNAEPHPGPRTGRVRWSEIKPQRARTVPPVEGNDTHSRTRGCCRSNAVAFRIVSKSGCTPFPRPSSCEIFSFPSCQRSNNVDQASLGSGQRSRTTRCTDCGKATRILEHMRRKAMGQVLSCDIARLTILLTVA